MSHCGGRITVPQSLWDILDALALAAVRGGGSVEVRRSRCISGMVAGLRLLGYRAEYVSSSRVEIREAGEAEGGSLTLRCPLPVYLLAPLAAARLGPGRRLLLRIQLPRSVLKALVEALNLLGARAWLLEGGRGEGLVVEAALPRRIVTGRLYTGWLPLVAGLIHASILLDTRLIVSLIASRIIGELWLAATLARLGISYEEAVRGTKIAFEPSLVSTSTVEPGQVGGAASVLLAALPLAEGSGEIELVELPRSSLWAAKAAAAQAGLVLEDNACNGGTCTGTLRPSREAALNGAQVRPARIIQYDPDYLYFFVALYAKERGGVVEAPHLHYEVGEVAESRLGDIRLTYEAPLLRIERIEDREAKTRLVCTNPLLCAAAYGLHAGSGQGSIGGLESLDDRLPGFLEVAEVTGCLS